MKPATAGWLLPACLAASSLIAMPAFGDDAPFKAQKGTKRAETRTAPGEVEPPPRVAAPAAGVAQEQNYLADPQANERAGDEAIEIFAKAYARGGSPRMAVYFNRVLSAEVREWVPGDRERTEIKVSHSAKAQSSSIGATKAGSEMASIEADAEATSDTQSKHYVGLTGLREDPAEAWKWEFEDAVTNAFLEANANIVDRAVIFRAMAKSDPNTAGMDGTISTNLNEMSALEKYADVLVELKVTRSSKSVVGYEFKATAKNVKTGRVLGSAFVKGDPDDPSTRKRYVGTSRGYQPEFNVADISRELASRLMYSMAPRMGK